MPTYEYRCKDCGHEFEAQQAFSDDPLTECPTCQGALKKKFGSVGISFKGSGFYKNDSRGGSSTSSTTGTTDTSTTSTSTTESTSTSTDSSSGSSSTTSAAPATSSSSSSSSTAPASA